MYITHILTVALWRYFRKFEKFTTPDPDQTEVDVAKKLGSGGPVVVGYNSFIHEISKGFVKACVGLKIPFNPVFNSSGTLGVNRVRRLFSLTRHPCWFPFIDEYDSID